MANITTLVFHFFYSYHSIRKSTWRWLFGAEKNQGWWYAEGSVVIGNNLFAMETPGNGLWGGLKDIYEVVASPLKVLGLQGGFGYWTKAQNLKISSNKVFGSQNGETRIHDVDIKIRGRMKIGDTFENPVTLQPVGGPVKASLWQRLKYLN